MKRTWAGEVRNVSLLVAIGVNAEGFREILGICEGAKEDKSGWSAFLRQLVDRGLKGVELITSDACRGWSRASTSSCRTPVATLRRTFLPQRLQPCAGEQGPRGQPHAQGDPRPGDPGNRRGQGLGGRGRLRRQRMGRAADLVDAHVAETLTYYAFPTRLDQDPPPTIRSSASCARSATNPGGRAFPDGQSCLISAAARLRHIAGTQWSTRKYMNMAPLRAAVTEAHGAVVA